MHQFAVYIVQIFEKHKIINPSPKEREIYVYGFDIAIYTLISTLGLILIGFLLGSPIESIIMILLFYVNQTLGGGYHASSHLSCFLVMGAGLGVYILLLRISFPHLFCVILGLVSLVLLYCHPLILHENKKFLAPKSPFFIKRSQCAIITQLILFLLLLFLTSSYYLQVFSIAFTLCAISRMIAALRQLI